MSGQHAYPPDLLQQPPAVRLTYFKERVFKHPLLLDATRALNQAIHEPAGASLIFVVGPSGAGKTTLRLKSQKRLLEETLPELEKDRGRIPVVGIEVASADANTSLWRDLYIRGLTAFDEVLIDRKIDYATHGLRSADGRPSGIHSRATNLELRYAFQQCVQYRRPKAIFLDEAQHLMNVASGRKLREQADTLKSLASLSETLLVLMGPHELLGLAHLSAQLSRRTRLIHLPRYRFERAEDQKAFKGLVHTFQCYFPLAEPPDLLEHWTECYERCLGCVGILKNWLTRGLAAALEDGLATVDFAYLDQYADSPAKLRQMALEIREGEAQLVEAKGDRTELRALLGLEGALPGSGAKRVVPPTTRHVRAGASRPTGRVGQRNPIRDPVGVKQHVG